MSIQSLPGQLNVKLDQYTINTNNPNRKKKGVKMAAHFFTLSIITLSLSVVASSGELESELVADLLSLQSESKSGVIHLDDRTVSKILTSPRSPRPYSFLIFFDAASFHDKPELRREFEIVASSFITNHNSSNTKLFFVTSSSANPNLPFSCSASTPFPTSTSSAPRRNP